jgi:predicted transcriptional regulator
MNKTRGRPRKTNPEQKNTKPKEQKTKKDELEEKLEKIAIYATQGKTQTQIAKLLNVKQPAISQLMKGVKFTQTMINIALQERLRSLKEIRDLSMTSFYNSTGCKLDVKTVYTSAFRMKTFENLPENAIPKGGINATVSEKMSAGDPAFLRIAIDTLDRMDNTVKEYASMFDKASNNELTDGERKTIQTVVNVSAKNYRLDDDDYESEDGD